MDRLPNRKERRLLAKQIGLLERKSKMKFADQLEISRKAREFGKKIHLGEVEKNLRLQDEIELQKQQKKIDDLISTGINPDDALNQVQSEN